MKELHYAWTFKEIKECDFGVYEVKRAERNGDGWVIEEPFTVVIHEYSKRGDYPLFQGLFHCGAWDPERGSDSLVSSDVKFCIELWKEFGLVDEYGPFTPIHIQPDHGRIPVVYRRPMHQVLTQAFGCAHVDIERSDDASDITMCESEN